MQVDPMSRFNVNTKKMSSQSKIITLEGKTRLPARIQDVVIDIGNIVNSAQSSSASGEVSQLPQLAKNYSVLEGTINNTLNTLKKLEKILDKSSDTNSLIEQSLPHIQNTVQTTDLIDQIHGPLMELKL